MAELWLAPEPGSGRRVLEAAHGLLTAAGVSVRDLDEVVVGVGPGGFTGLRIGLATALGLGQALGIPVTGASSLEALALAVGEVAPEDALVAAVQDARRRELFAAVYRHRRGNLEVVLGPTALAPEDLAAHLGAMDRPVWIGGGGIAVSGEAFDAPGMHVAPPGGPGNRLSACALVRRIRAGAGRPARPEYARLPDAEVNRLRALEAAG